jgi:hypothetical protein
MTTRDQYVAYVQRTYEDLTQETVGGGWPLQFSDDFVGGGHTAGIPAAGSPVAGYPWVKKIVGSAPPTVALDTNSVGGTVSDTLTNTSQAQEAGLYWNDSLSLDVTKKGMIEFRAALAVLPTGFAGAALGVGSAWVSGGFLSLARYLGFGWAASGALLVYALDGVQSAVSVAAAPIGGSAITSDTNQHYFRIDWTNNSDIAFYYDGNRVNAVGSVTWTATAGANSNMQPWADVYKASGTGVGTLTVDKVDAFNGR